MVRVHYKPSRVLEVAPSWPRHGGAILLTPMLTRDSVKEGNPILRVSVFHGWVVQEPALRHTIIHTPLGCPLCVSTLPMLKTPRVTMSHGTHRTHHYIRVMRRFRSLFRFIWFSIRVSIRVRFRGRLRVGLRLESNPILPTALGELKKLI